MMMIIIRNNIIPVKGYSAMMICGVLFIRKDVRLTDAVIEHEGVHFKQFLECLTLPFYVLYGLEYFIKLVYYGRHDKAYRSISFEREAYDYIPGSKRKMFGWIKRLFK